MEEIDKCELIDCWFYIDHTPPKGQGDWGGAIHKGACKLNSTDCKDTPTEKCLVKSLYKQLKRKEKECEDLRSENAFYDETGYNQVAIRLQAEINKLKKECEELKNCDKTLIYKQARNNFEKLNKLKQALQEIKKIVEPILEVSIIDRLQGETYTGKYILAEQILQIISEVEE